MRKRLIDPVHMMTIANISIELVIINVDFQLFLLSVLIFDVKFFFLKTCCTFLLLH